MHFYFLLLVSLCGMFLNGAVRENKITVVITSFNNERWYERNVRSVLYQDYTNFDVIYINDCSTDNTGQLVQELLEKEDKNKKFKFINNSYHRSQMFNHWRALWMTDDDCIVIQVDGDDWLYDNQVLKKINLVYQDPNVWLTFGGTILYPNGGLDYHLYNNQFAQDCFSKEQFRVRGTFFHGHLRTFRSWLLKKVQMKDFLLFGNFHSMAPAPDLPMMLPMMEMAGKNRIRYISTRDSNNIFYCQNRINEISQDKIIGERGYDPLLSDLYSRRSYSKIDLKKSIKISSRMKFSFYLNNSSNLFDKNKDNEYLILEPNDYIYHKFSNDILSKLTKTSVDILFVCKSNNKAVFKNNNKKLFMKLEKNFYVFSPFYCNPNLDLSDILFVVVKKSICFDKACMGEFFQTKKLDILYNNAPFNEKEFLIGIHLV